MEKAIHSDRFAMLQALLRQARLDAGLRQSDLAKRLGQPQSFVSKVEGGERRLDLIELQQYCEAMGIRTSVFVQRFLDAANAS